MSLERMIEEIRAQGQREAEQVVDAAQRERERTLSEVQSRGEELLGQRTRQAEDQGAREEVRETARAELEARKALLQAQKEVLDEVRAMTRDRLRELDDRGRLLESLVDRHRDDLEGAAVRSNPQDREILAKLVRADVTGDLAAIGGFVIESQEGDQRIDLTFDTFLDGLWEGVVREVADILWQEA